MIRYAFTFDSTACSGCKACQAACKDKHNLPVGMLWRRVYEVAGGGWLQRDAAWVSDVFAYNLSLACNHCERPICAEVCPANAYTIRPDGLVLLDTTKCLGCKYCSWACPYGAPQYDERAGHMTKCTFCVDNLEAGQPPACVAACPMRVLDVADRSSATVTPPVYPLPDARVTEPALRLKPHAAASRATPESARVRNWEEISPRHAESPLEERALIAFTLLSQWAVGAFWWLSAAAAWLAASVNVAAWLLISAIMIAGVLASLGHLGRPLRAWRVFGNLRRSWLSREIAFATAFAGGSILYAFSKWLSLGTPEFQGGLSLLTSVAGVGLMVSMGRAYQLRTVPAWRTALMPLSFFITALLLGTLSAAIVLSSAVLDLTLVRIAVVTLTLGQGAIGRAWRAGLRSSTAGRESAQRIAQRRSWLWARAALAVVGTLVAVLAASTVSWLLAFGLIVAAELIGRVLFYAARVRQGV